MILIGENIHIISKEVRRALENKDQNFVKNLIKIQQKLYAIDLNIGPAKNKLDNIFEWILELAPDCVYSFDTTNIKILESGLANAKNPEKCFINSTSADKERLERITELAIRYNCNLIALAMNKNTGIPKTADGRMELVCEIFEYCTSQGIDSKKLFFDPLVLPIKSDNSQPFEAINTLKMINESFENSVNTIIGLSNVSNGIAKDLRPFINRVYAVLAYGAGLSSAIIDAKDSELVRIINMLKCNNPSSDVDNLFINLANMIQCFGELEEINYDKNDKNQCQIIKTAQMLLNKKIYSDSFATV